MEATDPPAPVEGRGRRVVTIAILAVVYVLAARLGLALDAAAGFASLVWAPSGVALAALVLRGPRVWPAVALGALLANLWAGAPIAVALGIAVGNTLEAVLGAYALRRLPGSAARLHRVGHAVVLIVVAAGFSTTVSATLGVTSLAAGGIVAPGAFAETWRAWWLGDAIGVLVVAPLLLVWGASARPSFAVRPVLEAAALGLTTVVAGTAIYGWLPPGRGAGQAFVVFPILIWASLRFGPRGAATTTFLVALIAVWGTALGRGPFARGNLFEGLLALQGFIAIMAATFLILGASIAERRRAAGVLRDSEARKAGILEASLDCILSIDHRGTLVEYNAAAERTFGFRRDDAIGKEMAALLIPERFREAHRAGMAHYLATREGPLLGKRIEVTALRADGTEFPAELAITPIQTAGPPMFTGHLRDVSDRKRAEEASERQFRTMIEWMPQLAWWARPDGYIAYYNPRWYEYTGTTPADMEGWGWKSVHDPALLPSVLERWQHSIVTGERFEMEFPIRGRDGVFRWFLTRVTPMRGDGGEIIRWIGINTDIDDQKRVERQRAELLLRETEARTAAESASRAKDEFLAMLGHELRNPLAPIRTALELMRLRGAPGIERERGVIERQVTHLVRLVDDLLDVSRITRGKVELARDVLDLAEITARAVETASPLMEQRRQRLRVEVPAGLAVVGDSHRLQQVFANLVGNASKYTPEEGSITMIGARDGETIVVRVSDTGVGLSAELLPVVFDLFVQGHQNIDRPQGGLGLGLAIVRRLVDLHGGQVEAASAGLGHGSTFSVRLPAARGDTRGQELAAPPTSVVASRPKGLSVLVVDDNEDAAEMLAALLDELGYTVRIARDGPAALGLLATFTPDVAVLDIGLPVMDGYELARRVRQQLGPASVRLIALTGYGQASDRARSTEAGFDAHLVKPVDLEELGAALGSATTTPPSSP